MRPVIASICLALTLAQCVREIQGFSSPSRADGRRVAVDSTRVSPSSSNYGKPSDLTPGRCSRPFSGLPVVRSSVDSKETVWDRITGLKLFKTVTTWEGVHAVPLVPLRFMSGLLMVHHGSEGGMLPANFGTPEFSGFVDFVVSPYFGFLPGTPEFWSAVHDYTEFWGGWCLVLGFLTRPAALSLFVTMMGAVYFHLSSVGPQGFPLGHVPNYSYDFEEPTLYGLIFLLFWFNGAGPLSIDSLIYQKISTMDEIE